MVIHRVENGGIDRLPELKKVLLGLFESSDVLVLEISSGLSFDLSFVQLLYSAQIYAAKRGKSFFLQGDEVQRLEKMRNFAGLPALPGPPNIEKSE